MIFKLEINYKPARLVFPYSYAFVADRERVQLKRNDITTSFKMAGWKIVFSASPQKWKTLLDNGKNIYLQINIKINLWMCWKKQGLFCQHTPNVNSFWKMYSKWEQIDNEIQVHWRIHKLLGENRNVVQNEHCLSKTLE